MQRLSPLKVLAYSCGNFAAGLYYAFNSFGLPIFLSLFTSNAILIGWLSSSRSFEQVIIQPLVGARSDRTHTRLGRRAPFFLAAMPISALLLALTGNLPEGADFLVWAVAGVFLFSLFFNVGIDPYIALLADVTPSEQRGSVSGFSTLLGLIGQVVLLVAAALFFKDHHELVFYLVGASLIVGFVIVALGVREKNTKQSEEQETSGQGTPEGQPNQGNVFNRVGNQLKQLPPYARERWHEDPEAVKLLGVKFIYQIGINAAVPFLTLFVVTRIGNTGWQGMLSSVGLGTSPLGDMDATGIAFVMGAVLLVSTAIFALPVGLLGDRFGKKPIFALGLLIMGIFAFIASFATSIPQLMLYLVFIGFGNAAQTVLYFPYLTDLIAPDRAGEFQGLSASAEAGGVFLSILIAGELINSNLFNLGYSLAFLVTGTFLLLGFVAVLFVKSKRSEARVEPVSMETGAVVP